VLTKLSATPNSNKLLTPGQKSRLSMNRLKHRGFSCSKTSSQLLQMHYSYFRLKMSPTYTTPQNSNSTEKVLWAMSTQALQTLLDPLLILRNLGSDILTEAFKSHTMQLSAKHCCRRWKTLSKMNLRLSWSNIGVQSMAWSEVLCRESNMITPSPKTLL
jgi:hypothetical protein